jgi:hypothetical protein
MMIVNDEENITQTINFYFLHFLHTGFSLHTMEEHLKLLASNAKARS